MQVVDICRALYKISTGTLASRGPSATAGLLVLVRLAHLTLIIQEHFARAAWTHMMLKWES